VALSFEKKKEMVKELTELIGCSVSVVAADYCGLTVSEMTELRAMSREKKVKVGVYRNTLVRKAVEKTPFSCLHAALVGPILLLFSFDEPGAGARLLSDFMKSHEKIAAKALVLDGQLLGADQLKAIASLPSRDEAIGQLMSVMQAPITQLVRTLNEPVAQAVRTFRALRDQKQAT